MTMRSHNFIASILTILLTSQHAAFATNLLRAVPNSLSSPSDESLLSETWHFREEFQSWAKKFGKVYSSAQEELKRMVIWIENHEIIAQHNKKNLSYKLGHNQFSDLTNEEYQKHNFLGPFFPRIKKPVNEVLIDADAAATSEARVLLDFIPPSSLDWRDKGAVTPVKNQGSCGSCWAFSTTGSIEGAVFIKTGQLVSLSEQNLIDCDPMDLGCNGGIMDNAYQYIGSVGGLCSEDEYPYISRQQLQCKSSDCTFVKGTNVVNHYDLPPHSADMLMRAISVQPVSVAVRADKPVFQFYASGVLEGDDCGTEVDHAVLAIGYGTDDETGKDYFLIKNSWSSDWGEKGYIRIARDSDEDAGTCGVLTMGTMPVVTV